MAERNGAAVGIDVLGIIGKPKLAQHSESLRREGLVQLDHIQLFDISRLASASTFRVAGTGPMPMIRGSTPAVAPATIRARGVSPKRRTASSTL